MSYYMKEPIFRGSISLCSQCKKMGIRKLLKNCAKHTSKYVSNKTHNMKEPIFRGSISLCPQCKKMGIRKLLKNCAKHTSKYVSNKSHNLPSYSQSSTNKYNTKNHYGAFSNDFTDSNNDQHFNDSSFYPETVNYSKKQNNYAKHHKNNTYTYHHKSKPQSQSINNNNHSYNNNNGNNHRNFDLLERMAPSTIELAEATGMYTPDQIGYLKATKNSEEKEDVLYHRGVQYTLKKGLESVGMKWKDFPEADFNTKKIKNEYNMNKQERHNQYDNPQNMPGLSEILFPDDSEMAQGFKEWVNEYDGLDDIQDCFD